MDNNIYFTFLDFLRGFTFNMYIGCKNTKMVFQNRFCINLR